MTLPPGSVVLNAQGAQNPDHADRGIARYTVHHAQGLLEVAPDAIRSIAVADDRPVPPALAELARIQPMTPGRRPAGPAPSIFHVLSPFEMPRTIDEVWPMWTRGRDSSLVVTLYDLIPLVMAEHYLVDNQLRAAYLSRLDLIRAADHVLAISERTAADAVERLGVPEERVTVIDAGVSPHFSTIAADTAQTVLDHEIPALRPGYLLYVGGIEFRKNIERLVIGYARMSPAARARHQLVIVCRIIDEDRARLEQLGREHGLVDGELLLTGYVTDDALSALYQQCRLFVFASFYEGSGLPILEAMASGAPVVAASGSTTPEIFGDLDGTFDPFDVDDIGATLERFLEDDAALDRLRRRSAERVGLYTWRRTAERTVEAYERTLARPRTSRRARSRPRVAWWSPWPPEASGVANYSARIVEELRASVDVDVFVTGRVATRPGRMPDRVRLLPADGGPWAEQLRTYDRVVYSMGNSEFHAHVYDELSRRAGVVLLHDVRLLGFYRWYGTFCEGPEDGADTEHGRLADRIAQMYPGRLDRDELATRWPTLAEEREQRLLMTHEIQQQAERIVVHSEHAAALLRADLDGTGLTAPPIDVLAHGVPVRPRLARSAPRAEPVVLSLGLLSSLKQLDVVIDAFARIREALPGARLVLAGPGGDEEEERWRTYAADAGLADAVEVTGHLPAERYEQVLADADVAIQLRLQTNGEASGAVVDCVSVGLPTIVTDDAWASELPRDAVSRVPPGADAEAVADAALGLLRDPERWRARAVAARAYAEATSYQATAQRLLDVLELGDGQADR